MRVFSSKNLGALALLLGGVAAGWLALRAPTVNATPPAPRALQAEQAVDVSEAVALDGGVAQSSNTATIVFMTVPYTTAVVTWGKKPLGKILPGKPLVVVRPRDSGPLDVMVRAGGYLPVQTRAHTFSDSRVAVKLTPLDKKSELLGYRIPLEAGVPEGGLPEAGVPDDAGRLPVFPPPPVAPVPVPAPTPVF